MLLGREVRTDRITAPASSLGVGSWDLGSCELSSDASNRPRHTI